MELTDHKRFEQRLSPGATKNLHTSIVGIPTCAAAEARHKQHQRYYGVVRAGSLLDSGPSAKRSPSFYQYLARSGVIVFGEPPPICSLIRGSRTFRIKSSGFSAATPHAHSQLLD